MSKYRITMNGTVYEMEVELVSGDQPVRPAAQPAPVKTEAPKPAAVQSPAQPAAAKPAVSVSGEGSVCSPMPGTVLRLLAAEGDTVKAGQPVAVLEAMKMENEVPAARDGKVRRILVAAGQTVAAGEALMEIE